MPLSIEDLETERLARALAERTGESITLATRRAIEERLQRVGAGPRRDGLLEYLPAIRRRSSALASLDRRSADDIIGYEENGLPR
jgi:antitoxin VapB